MEVHFLQGIGALAEGAQILHRGAAQIQVPEGVQVLDALDRGDAGGPKQQLLQTLDREEG